MNEEAIFQTDPTELVKRCGNLPAGSWIVIDEVQKAPKLLDLVQKLIEEQKLNFALSGSSARKLKRGGANLLAGRAFVQYLFPFAYSEIIEIFDLQQALEWGCLPKIFEFSDELDKKRYLQAYANTYLKEEIQAEQIVRNLPVFRKFLEVASQMNGKPVNYTKIARDIHTDHSVVRNHFSIMEDTLIGFLLPAYEFSIRKQQRKAAKFYLVDCGIKRALDKTLDIPLRSKTYEYGRAFEHFLVAEFFKICKYRERDESLSYLQTKDGAEVDLIIQRPGKSSLFLEIKSTSQVTDPNFTILTKMCSDVTNVKGFVLSMDPHMKSVSGVTAYHWQQFMGMFQNDEV